jgi:hypothetical protein
MRQGDGPAEAPHDDKGGRGAGDRWAVRGHGSNEREARADATCTKTGEAGWLPGWPWHSAGRRGLKSDLISNLNDLKPSSNCFKF